MGFSAGDSKKGANLFKVRYLPLSLEVVGNVFLLRDADD
jgi:hypothetical protein